MKNKFMALFVLAIFIVSLLPMAIAEDGSDNGRDNLREIQKERMKNRGEEALKNRIELAKSKVNFLEKHKKNIRELVLKCAEKGTSAEDCKGRFEARLKNLEDLPEKFQQRVADFESRMDEKKKEMEDLKNDKDFGKFKQKLKFKARGLDNSLVEKARENYLKARFNEKEAKQKVEKAKLRLEEAKELRQCRDNNTSDECNASRAELLAAAKEHFSAQADQIMEILGKIKSKAQANEDFSDEDEATIVAAIDAEIAKINATKVKINAAQNKQELLDAAKELKNEWNRIRNVALRYSSFIVGSRMARIIVKSKHLETKLDRVLQRMTENGQNVSEVQELVDEFHAEISAASTSFKASQSLWLKVKLGQEQNATVQEAQAKLKEAREHLKNANKLLSEIAKKLDKKAMKEVEDEDELEDDDSDSDDSEDDSDSDSNETGNSTIDGSAGASTNVSANASTNSENAQAEANLEVDAALQVSL